MPKIVIPLTDSQCKNLAIPTKGTNQLSDGNGLYLQAFANGSKFWRFMYTQPYTKTRQEMRLGTYPEISLKQARLKREELNKLLLQDIDPKQHQQQAEQQKHSELVNTFEAVARQWHAHREEKAKHEERQNWSEAHSKRVLRSLELHIFPAIGKQPIHEIQPLQVLQPLKELERAGKNDTAHKVYDVTNQVFRYAVKMRLQPYNPVAELREELAQVKQKHFAHLEEPKEIAQLLHDIDRYTGTPQAIALLKISPYVFTRPSELRLMKWQELDFKNQLWTKEAKDMKNRIAHIIPLSRQVIALLQALKPITERYESVFHNIGTNKPLSEGVVRKALIQLGYKDKQTAHGFRHIASTYLNESGKYNGDWIEYQLAHKDPNISRKQYNHAKYLEQRRQMMQEWADYLDQLKQQYP